MNSRNLQVFVIKALADNYVYALKVSNKNIVVIDPSESSPVFDFTDSTGLEVSYILNTHHHWDHVDGNLEIKERFDCEIVTSRTDFSRIPGATKSVGDGEVFEIDSISMKALAIPGHTLGHTAYQVGSSLFAGDTLFAMGCGRNFEGTLEQLWSSLLKIRSLAEDTWVYPGHEYALKNSEFARSLDLHIPLIEERYDLLRTQMGKGTPMTPFQLKDELATNPFYLCTRSDVKTRLGFSENTPDLEVFSHLRELRNQF